MQSNLGYSTNTPTTIVSLYFFEAIYFKMLCVVKMCYFKKTYQLNFIKKNNYLKLTPIINAKEKRHK